MMCKIIFYHLFGQLAGRNTKKASCPKMPPPISFLHMRKLLKYLARCATFYSAHYFRRRDTRRSRYQNVDMVVAHYSTQYLNFPLFTYLTDKFANTKSKVTLQHMVPIFRHPNKMIFYLKSCMTTSTIFHADEYNATAS